MEFFHGDILIYRKGNLIGNRREYLHKSTSGSAEIPQGENPRNTIPSVEA